MSFGRGVLWRNLGLTVRLGPLDGRVVFFLLLAIYHIAYWTLVVAFLGMISLYWMERIGYTLPNLMRKISVWIMGSHRPARTGRSFGRSDR